MKHPDLTPMQWRVMVKVGEGLTNQEIAHELGIAPRTVDAHVAAAMRALDAPNRLAAARAAGTMVPAWSRPPRKRERRAAGQLEILR